MFRPALFHCNLWFTGILAQHVRIESKLNCSKALIMIGFCPLELTETSIVFVEVGGGKMTQTHYSLTLILNYVSVAKLLLFG